MTNNLCFASADSPVRENSVNQLAYATGKFWAGLPVKHLTFCFYQKLPLV